MLCHEPEVERKFDESDDIIATSEVALVEIEDVKENSYELDQQIEQMIEISEDIWQCKECTKTSRLKMNIRKHAETHIGGVSHTCHLCNKTYSTRNSLQVHISNVHSELSFSCNICDKSGMTKIGYMNHKRKCKVSA